MIDLWQQPVSPDTVKKKAPLVTITREEAEKTAEDSLVQLSYPGYCLWKCQLFDGDVIAVVDDEVHWQVPAGYPVYTLRELKLTEELPDRTCRLVHLVKKRACAVVTWVEKREKGG